MSKNELHDWEYTIEKLSSNNADKMLDIAQDIYNTAFVRGKNYMSLEQPRWIPISEKLPEDYQRVLVTVVSCWGIEVVRVAEYSNQKKIFQIKESNDKWKVGEEGLLAWMPLPLPKLYKESEGKE